MEAPEPVASSFMGTVGEKVVVALGVRFHPVAPGGSRPLNHRDWRQAGEWEDHDQEASGGGAHAAVKPDGGVEPAALCHLHRELKKDLRGPSPRC